MSREKGFTLFKCGCLGHQSETKWLYGGAQNSVKKGTHVGLSNEVSVRIRRKLLTSHSPCAHLACKVGASACEYVLAADQSSAAAPSKRNMKQCDERGWGTRPILGDLILQFHSTSNLKRI